MYLIQSYIQNELVLLEKRVVRGPVVKGYVLLYMLKNIMEVIYLTFPKSFKLNTELYFSVISLYISICHRKVQL